MYPQEIHKARIGIWSFDLCCNGSAPIHLQYFCLLSIWNSYVALDKVCAFCDKFASDLFCPQSLGDRKTSARERNLPSRPRLGARSAPCRAGEREREREICLTDQEWAREVCKAVQEWKRETLYQKWVQSDQYRYAAGIVMGTEGSLAYSKQRNFGSWLIQEKTFRIATGTRHKQFEQRLEARIQVHLCWLRGIVMLCLQFFDGSF